MTTYRRLDSAPPVDRPCLHVTWARLAILWWRDVAVTTIEPVELNELDEFAMSAVGSLGYLHAPAFEEFTGLPPLIFNGLARRLHSLGLLEWRDGLLRPSDGPGRPETVGPPSRTATATLDFLYLPETDDLIVVDESLAVWERAAIAPVGAAPLPRTLHHTSVRTLLADRIQQRRIPNLPDNIIALAGGDDEALTTMTGAKPQPPVPVCPVFQCAATVVRGQHRPEIQLDVTGATKRRRQNEPESRVTIDISGATGLVQRWSHAVNEFADEPDEADKAMRALGLTEPPWPSLRSDEAGSWWLPINGRQAQALAHHALLTVPIGLEVRQRHARVAAALQLEPADEDARKMIERDSVLQEVLQDQGPQGRPIGRHNLNVRDVGGITALRARAWQLKYYSLVHAMREAEDFDYA
jgi:hypothetical protein